MGIKGLSKTIGGKEIKLKDLDGLSVAIDASVVVYKACLGAKNINVITDGDGNPTLHINVLIAKCLNFHKAGVEQYWVFDHNSINPDKVLELQKRKDIKKKAQKKINELKKQKSESSEKRDDLFSSDTEDDEIEEKIQTQERITFSMTDKIIADCKFILDCFNISYTDAPKDVEAEHICALLTDVENDDSIADAVFSTDMDVLPFGGVQLIRELKVNQKKKLMLYTLDDILENNNLDMDSFRKVCVILGSDFAPKTAGIGPKSVLKKYKNIDLTTEQKKAIKLFEKQYNISKLKWRNGIEDSFDDKGKINKLLEWLRSKNFNIERIRKQISKAL